MVRISAFLLTLLMASTVLADDLSFTTVPQRIELGEPAPALPPTTDPPKEIQRTPQQALATVNFNYDPRGQRIRHAHLAPNGKSFRPCNDPKCRVPVPENLHLCPTCNWSVCQCEHQGRGQSPDLPPAPSGTFQSFPSAGMQNHVDARCCAPPPKPRKTIAGFGFQICKLHVGAGITAPKRDCGCGCGGKEHDCIPPRRTIVGGGVNVLGLGAGAGVTWGK